MLITRNTSAATAKVRIVLKRRSEQTALAARCTWYACARSSAAATNRNARHAIDRGNLIFEIQQNSDTTYRLFDWNRLDSDGKPRKLHVSESLACTDYEDVEPALGVPEGEVIASCPHFHVERWELREARKANSLPRFAVFQCVAGVVRYDGATFKPGDLFLIPAFAHDQLIGPEQGGTVVLRTTLPAKETPKAATGGEKL
jgi:mannose-6-phosphate isomerase class I